jgi:serine/threonine protein kinase/Tfp pilus assembly protein PilF
MNDSDYSRVKEIFCQAIELPIADRDLFLDQQCGENQKLRASVLDLLAADAQPLVEDFPEFTSMVDSYQDAQRQSWIGRQLGPYKLLEHIGQGGMGDVYRAVRTTDFTTEVAVKIARFHHLTPASLQRFRDEIRFQADLGKHQNIAAIFDAGEADGHPYFVMEYITGVRIDQYCDQRQLTTEQRIELFCQVCQAVQYAHQNAVIHRDLKPANILVTEDGRPILIDFGIAKLVSAEADAHTHASHPAAYTPDYASPEQVRAESLTTATDIYSLGIILYELLTGHRPYSLDSTRSDLLVRQILESTPLTPSEVVSTNQTVQHGKQPSETVTPDKVCQQRSTRLHRLQRQLRGDLDAIVLTALKKQSEQRYATAAQLAEDLQRFLRGEPVHATPDRWLYRTRKFIARNRTSVAASLVLFLAILAGLFGTSYGFLQARQQRDLAEANFDQALQAIDRMLIHVGDDDLANMPHMSRVRRAVLEDALELCHTIASRQPTANPRMQSELGRVHLLVGRIYEDLVMLDKSQQAYQRGVQILTELASERSASPDDLQRLAQGRFDLGVVADKLGRVEEAKTAYQTAWDHYRQLQQSQPKDPRSAPGATNAASALATLIGNDSPDQAIEMLQQTIDEQKTRLTADSSDIQGQVALAAAYNNLGVLLAELPTRITEATKAHLQALELRRAVCQTTPDDLKATEELVTSYNNLAYAQYRQAHYDAAVATFQTGIELQQQLARSFPGYPKQRQTLAKLQNNLGACYAEMNHFDQAVQVTNAALIEQRALISDFPNVPAYREEFVYAAKSLGNIYRDMNQLELAKPLFDEVRIAAEFLVEQFPDVARYRLLLAETLTERASLATSDEDTRNMLDAAEAVGGENSDVYRNRGRAHARAGRWTEAITEFTRAIELDPHDPDTFDRRGVAYRNTDQPALAVDDYTKAIELVPDSASYWRRRGSCYRDLGDHDKALSDYAEAIRLQPDYGTAHNSQGVAYEDLGRYQEAIDSYTNALKFVDDDPIVWENRGNVFLATHQWPLAVDDFSRAIELSTNNPFAHARRAKALRNLQQWDEALRDYSEALTQDNQMLEAWHGRGWVLAHLSRWDEALDDYDYVARQSPLDGEVRLEQWLVAIKDGDSQRLAALRNELSSLTKNFDASSSEITAPEKLLLATILVNAAPSYQASLQPFAQTISEQEQTTTRFQVISAWSWYRAEDFAKAEELVAKALSHAQPEPDPWLDIAKTLQWRIANDSSMANDAATPPEIPSTEHPWPVRELIHQLLDPPADHASPPS